VPTALSRTSCSSPECPETTDGDEEGEAEAVAAEEDAVEETVGETTGIRIEGHEDRDVAVEEGPGDRRVEGMAVDREAVMEDPEGHAVTADLEEVVADDSDPQWAADMEAEDGEEDLGEVTMDHLAHAVAADEAAEDTDINLSVMASMEDVPGGIGGVVAMERGIAAIGGHLKSAKKKEN